MNTKEQIMLPYVLMMQLQRNTISMNQQTGVLKLCF